MPMNFIKQGIKCILCNLPLDLRRVDPSDEIFEISEQKHTKAIRVSESVTLLIEEEENAQTPDVVQSTK
jgi:hypothetical protein